MLIYFYSFFSPKSDFHWICDLELEQVEHYITTNMKNELLASDGLKHHGVVFSSLKEWRDYGHERSPLNQRKELYSTLDDLNYCGEELNYTQSIISLT